jgi:hypothetical protein
MQGQKDLKQKDLILYSISVKYDKKICSFDASSSAVLGVDASEALVA